MKIYRRSAPYATLARHGLYFLAFACARERHRIQLDRMYGVSGDGLHDRLIEFSRADTGSYLFAPGERALAEALDCEASGPGSVGSDAAGSGVPESKAACS